MSHEDNQPTSMKLSVQDWGLRKCLQIQIQGKFNYIFMIFLMGSIKFDVQSW